MKQALVVALTAAMTLGCYGLANKRLRRDLGAWIGRPITELVSEWGPATQVVPNGDGTIYLWFERGSTVATSFGDVAVARTNSCSVWFDVSADGTITKGHWKGRC